MEISKLRVFYGFTRLNKIRKKRELVVQFENSCYNKEKNLTYIKRDMFLVHTRFQTIEEAKDSDGAIKTFTKYSSKIDEKPWNGDIEKVLENNFRADEKYVSEEEREQIRTKLRREFKNYGKCAKCVIPITT